MVEIYNEVGAKVIITIFPEDARQDSCGELPENKDI